MSDSPRCSRCLLPATLPSVTLGEDGVCNHCRNYDAWLATFTEREDESRLEFERLVQRAKSFKRAYDVLIPLSGGKDSTYALYLCSKVFNMKCLCVTFDNGYLSEYGKGNIENALKATGADHIVYRMDRDRLIRLYGLFVRKTGSFCAICNRGIEVAIRAAVKTFDAPLVVAGHGMRPHHLSDGFMPELQQGGDIRYVRSVLLGEALAAEAEPLLAFPNAYGTLDAVANAIAGMLPSRLLRRAFWALHARGRRLIGALGIEKNVYPRYINYQDYIDIPAPVVRETLEREMGWRAPAGKFDHVDCLIEPVKVYIQTQAFPELSREMIRNSGRLRSGQMTREAAWSVEQELQGDDWTPPTLGPLLDDLGMTDAEFRAAVRDWRKMDSFRTSPAFPYGDSNERRSLQTNQIPGER